MIVSDTMARPSRDQVKVSFRVSRSGDQTVRAEAFRREVTVSELYREIMKIGWAHYRHGERA